VVTKSVENPDPGYQAKLANYDRLVATIPEVARRGATNPFTALNGHMFSYLHPGGAVALRLPPGLREAFLQKYRTTLFKAYGVIQREYVTVPDDLLADTDRLRGYFRASYDYVRSMKPKPAVKARK
jgi:hypothetical protein